MLGRSVARPDLFTGADIGRTTGVVRAALTPVPRKKCPCGKNRSQSGRETTGNRIPTRNRPRWPWVEKIPCCEEACQQQVGLECTPSGNECETLFSPSGKEHFACREPTGPSDRSTVAEKPRQGAGPRRGFMEGLTTARTKRWWGPAGGQVDFSGFSPVPGVFTGADSYFLKNGTLGMFGKP